MVLALKRPEVIWSVREGEAFSKSIGPKQQTCGSILNATDRSGTVALESEFEANH
jgi:hypothetical protein